MGKLSRRDFLVAALGTGVVAAVPPNLQRRLLWVGPPRPSGPAGVPDGGLFFFTPHQYETCAAICARIVPTGDDPSRDPGATEAHAAVFIDRFLAAFELPGTVANGPAVYVHGRYSGRNPFPDNSTGTPSRSFPPDDFLTATSPSAAQLHTVPLGPYQELSWRARLYGPPALDHLPAGASPKWRAQVGTLIPAPVPLRTTYREGLAAFDRYSQDLFGVPFAKAEPAQQDVMLEAAGNVVASPLPLPSPPGAPEAAKALFPVVTVHTFQGCYGLPEYRWLNQANAADPTGLWRLIGWDGDTHPLGNTIYNDSAYGPGQGPNAGFGEPGVYQPRGGYREYRAVSHLDAGDGRTLDERDLAPLVEALRKAGVLRPRGVRP